MDRLAPSRLSTRLRGLLFGPEALALLAVVVAIEALGAQTLDDLDICLRVAVLVALPVLGCSLARFRRLPLTVALVDAAAASFHALRARLVLSLGLDFHPGQLPRPPPFVALRRAVLVMALAAAVAYPARGVLRELVAAAGWPGLYTLQALVLGSIWAILVVSIAIMLPATVLAAMEVVRRRLAVEGPGRIVLVTGTLALVCVLLVSLDASVGLEGSLAVLAFGAFVPSLVRPVDPPRGPWLNIAMGRTGGPCTARIGEVVRDVVRLGALGAFVLVALMAPTERVDAAFFPLTDGLLSVYAWLAAWLFTGGATLAITEFNRRRRLFDPAFERSRVLWAVPGPEASALQLERAAIERAGWRLVVEDRMPRDDDADLLVGLPPGVVPTGQVPLSRVPPALFLLADSPAAVLQEAEEREKVDRVLARLEQLLRSARPQLGDRGEGTFLVPHCWLVVGLTRDDDRATGLDRQPSMTFGQSFQSLLGTRLRRFLFEVMTRAGVDVIYVEDSVTPRHVVQVLELLLERHVGRVEPPYVSEHDFVGITGVRIVLHDVDPEGEGLAGVDAHVTRNAISRARIMIIGRDRRDGGDDDDPPVEGESNDLWLRESLRNLFPLGQPA